MRLITSALPLLALAACSPLKPAANATAPLPSGPVVATARVEPSPVFKPATPPLATSLEIAEITFEGVSFNSQTHHLTVADQPNGPGTLYPDAATAGRSFGGLAAVNAGFFTPEGAPLGLVASSGRLTGSWNSASSLGNGVWYISATGNTAIARRGSFSRPDASTMRELIQAGPLLVENGRTASGLESTKTSPRTLISWDGGDRWWIGRTSPCTLAALGRAIATGQPAAWPVHTALNLDGGRSSDLWISGAVTGGPRVRRPVWNRPVRNFLVLLPK